MALIVGMAACLLSGVQGTVRRGRAVWYGLYGFGLVWGEVREARSLGWRLMQQYVGAIFSVAAVDSEVRLSAMRV
jgi:hypothetical protein